MKGINKGISVIVCCYNSAERLPETIKHIAMQRVSSYIHWEVIVINNASKDSTTKIAVQEWKKYNCVAAFQVIHQPLPGKRQALKKGIKNAKYEYLLICDDDNWLQRDYLNIAFEVMEKHPEVGVVGGQGQAVFEDDAPDWFNEYEEHYGIGPQAKKAGYVSFSRNWVYGAGSIIRKSLWETLIAAGFSGILPGPVGSRFSGGGEDVELCYAMKLAGFEIWYEDQLRFFHFMPKSRLNWQYFLKLIKTTARLSIFLKVYTLILNGSLPISSSKAAVRLIILKTLCFNLNTNIDTEKLAKKYVSKNNGKFYNSLIFNCFVYQGLEWFRLKPSKIEDFWGTENL